MGTVEENKEILQRYFDELFNNQDYSKGDEIIMRILLMRLVMI